MATRKPRKPRKPTTAAPVAEASADELGRLAAAYDAVAGTGAALRLLVAATLAEEAWRELRTYCHEPHEVPGFLPEDPPTKCPGGMRHLYLDLDLEARVKGLPRHVNPLLVAELRREIFRRRMEAEDPSRRVHEEGRVSRPRLRDAVAASVPATQKRDPGRDALILGLSETQTDQQIADAFCTSLRAVIQAKSRARLARFQRRRAPRRNARR